MYRDSTVAGGRQWRGGVNELALFAGIHGIGLGLKRAFGRRGLPFRTICYVEWDDYCVEILRARMRDGLLDDAPIWGDIRTFDGRPWAGLVDIVTGGFPCQDLSFAGKGAGLEGERSGLFFELLRVVRDVRPGIVLLENVPALLIRGFGRVAAEMAASGYDTQWDCIPAAAVGAPHRRDRVFILAYAAEHGGERSGVARGGRAGFEDGGEDVADTEDRTSGRLPIGTRAQKPEPRINGQDVSDSECERCLDTQKRQAAFPVFSGGYPSQRSVWAAEPDVGRVVDGVPSRVDRLRALGNAVVPQVAEYVGERLIEWLDSGG